MESLPTDVLEKVAVNLLRSGSVDSLGELRLCSKMLTEELEPFLQPEFVMRENSRPVEVSFPVRNINEETNEMVATDSRFYFPWISGDGSLIAFLDTSDGMCSVTFAPFPAGPRKTIALDEDANGLFSEPIPRCRGEMSSKGNIFVLSIGATVYVIPPRDGTLQQIRTDAVINQLRISPSERYWCMQSYQGDCSVLQLYSTSGGYLMEISCARRGDDCRMEFNSDDELILHTSTGFEKLSPPFSRETRKIAFLEPLIMRFDNPIEFTITKSNAYVIAENTGFEVFRDNNGSRVFAQMYFLLPKNDDDASQPDWWNYRLIEKGVIHPDTNGIAERFNCGFLRAWTTGDQVWALTKHLTIASSHYNPPSGTNEGTEGIPKMLEIPGVLVNMSSNGAFMIFDGTSHLDNPESVKLFIAHGRHLAKYIEDHWTGVSSSTERNASGR